MRLRGLARDRGWSLSEHGFVRLGEDGASAEGAAAERRAFATEAEVYAFLDLPFIEPELREDARRDRGGAGRSLPDLVTLGDLQGDCHTHSDWSDGHLSIEAGRRGHAAARPRLPGPDRPHAQPDHRQRPDAERVEDSARIIAELNAALRARGGAGDVPEGAHPDGFRLLHGCELEIRVDGELDYPDELLARYDVVVASLHVGRRQPRAQLMARYRTALHSPHVDIIAHPSGRKIGLRDDLDLDWEALYRAGGRDRHAARGQRLRRAARPGRPAASARAHAAGCRFVIDSDAHYRHEFDNLALGRRQARRGWLEASDVLNTRSREAFLAWMAGDRDV